VIRGEKTLSQLESQFKVHPILIAKWLQCELLCVNRSGFYYEPLGESEENLRLMRLLTQRL
jgi:hypothetical protein